MRRASKWVSGHYNVLYFATVTCSGDKSLGYHMSEKELGGLSVAIYPPPQVERYNVSHKKRECTRPKVTINHEQVAMIIL